MVYEFYNNVLRDHPNLLEIVEGGTRTVFEFFSLSVCS